MYKRLIEYITHSKDEVVILLYKEIIDLNLIDKIDIKDMKDIYNYIEQSGSFLEHNNISIIDDDIKRSIAIFKKINVH